MFVNRFSLIIRHVNDGRVRMPLLPETWLTHFASGVGHRIGSCDALGRPGIARALAADVLADGRVVVLMSTHAGPEVLEALRATRQVAAVFSHPRSMRTLHLKGVDAEVTSAIASDRVLLGIRRDAIYAELTQYGFTEIMLRTWYQVDPDDLKRVMFSISGAWDQTPGPGAGKPVQLLP